MIVTAPLFTDGDFTVATPVSLPVFQSPFPGVKDQWVFTQQWMQFLVNFSPATLGTAHPDTDTVHGPTLSDYVLVAEGDRQSVGNGIVTWTRTYAKLPNAREEWATIAYNFIGFYGVSGTNSASVSGRPRQVKTVPCRIAFDYWMTGLPDDTLIANRKVTTAGKIPIIVELKYFFEGQVSGNYSTDPTYGMATDFIGDVNVTIGNPTYPTRANYDILRQVGTVLSSTDGTLPFELVAFPSDVSRWLGPIYQRTTKYIKAQ